MVRHVPVVGLNSGFAGRRKYQKKKQGTDTYQNVVCVCVSGANIYVYMHIKALTSKLGESDLETF